MNMQGRGRFRRRAAAAGLLAASFFVSLPFAQTQVDLGFTSRVSALLKAQFAQKFGAGSLERIEDWMRQGKSQKQARDDLRQVAARGKSALPEGEILRNVNGYFNRVKYIEDITHWGLEDYWATPIEMVGSAGGDCEDYAIAKYYLLKELGVPVERLRITYVKALKLNQAHMVLAYYESKGAEPLILDNLDQQIRPASERPDLDPVYGFNDDEVEVTRTGQKAVPTQLRAWQNLQGRLVAQSRI
jgi:predicted transglutaminase-like cysteine proteinase